MKKLFGLLITILILLIFILAYKISKINTKNQNKHKSFLPVLYVDGDQIKRKDNQEKIQLKGVTSMAFSYDGYVVDKEFFLILEEVKLWGINLLGFYIDPNINNDRIKNLDYVVNWAENNYIYVFLTPRPSDHRNLEIQLRQIPSLMNRLAKRYSNKNNVFFGLGNEPNMTWKEWFNIADKVAKEIVKEKPNAVLLMTGVNFGRTFDFDKKLPYKNIIYDYHDYPADRIDDLQVFLKKEKIDFIWKNAIKKYPILISEFGGVWHSGFSSPEDLIYIQKVLDDINHNQLSYASFSLDNEEGLGLIDWKTRHPTKKGRLIKKDLKNYPPTDFSK